MTVYEVPVPTLDMVEELKKFDGILSISDMPVFDNSIEESTADLEIELPLPVEGRDYPLVGVLDTGISDAAPIKPWKSDRFHTNFDDSETDKRHGTMVTSIILFGDHLQGEKYTGSEGCKVMEAIVYPAQGTGVFTEYLLIANIREAIKNNPDIQIWNLSLGSNLQSDLYDFSDFGKVLDDLQEEYGILIVKSAGNCYNYRAMSPRDRISRSADSVRSLVVGSIAHDKS